MQPIRPAGGGGNGWRPGQARGRTLFCRTVKKNGFELGDSYQKRTELQIQIDSKDSNEQTKCYFQLSGENVWSCVYPEVVLKARNKVRAN